MELHHEGQVDGVVSAGNSGAVMASAMLQLGRMRGVKRPAIGSLVPNGHGGTFLLDVGANVDCKSHHLFQFAVMGDLYMRNVHEVDAPKIGLLNIGEESFKGNEVVKEAYELLHKSALNFLGNREGRDIMTGEADVLVCDGFTGNVVLKFAESFNGVYSKTLKRKIGKKVFSNIGAFLLRPTFERLRRIYDYEEYGGAPLLGINGNCIICHGSSTPKAIKHAVIEAASMIKQQVNEKISRELVAMTEEADGE
jgi:glycerol-3-phosphate acyltransferase PlsX